MLFVCRMDLTLRQFGDSDMGVAAAASIPRRTACCNSAAPADFSDSNASLLIVTVRWHTLIGWGICEQADALAYIAGLGIVAALTR
jgi:hypothetical protein